METTQYNRVSKFIMRIKAGTLVARAPAPQTESTWKPPHSIHLEVQEPEKK